MPIGLTNEFLYSAKKIIVIAKKDEKYQLIRGTGFFIKKNNDIIFVTNRHVVDLDYKNEELKGYNIISFQIETFKNINSDPTNFEAISIINFNEFIFSSDESNDVACLFNIKVQSLDQKINTCIPYELLADNDFFLKKVCVCDKIAYPGFSRYYNKITNAPIFRMGTIASDPRYDYSGDENIKSLKCVAYEGFSSGGSSGSPVFLLQKGIKLDGGLTCNNENFFVETKLLGINAGHYIENRVCRLIENENGSINLGEHAVVFL